MPAVVLLLGKYILSHKRGFLEGLGIALIVGLLMFRGGSQTITIRTPDPDTKIVTVPKTTLDIPTVNQVISDPLVTQEVKRLKTTKTKVTQVSQTVGTLSSQGSGIPQVVIVPSGFNGTFKDDQLSATFNEKSFTYDLNQQFKVISSSGIDTKGQKVEAVKLYQIRNGTPVPVKAQTVFVTADTRIPHWLVSPRIQAGLGVLNDKSTGAVVSFQWLKHGKDTSAEDVKFSILSPAVFVNGSRKELGVLPVSINLGSIPHQPFTNLWVSPFVGKNVIGGVVGATF